MVAKKRRWPWIVAGVLGVLWLAAWLAWSIFQTRWYNDALPVQLRTVGLVNQSSNAVPMPLVHEASGAVIYTMASETRDEIRRDGLTFLNEARQGRGHPGEAFYAYGTWKPTPMQYGELIDSLFTGAGGIDAGLQKRIRNAAGRPGGFYTTKDEAILLVLPDLGVIVFSYSG